MQIKDSRSYHFIKHDKEADQVTLLATVIAVLAHAGVIFGISFTEAHSPDAVVQDVTTVLTDNLAKNEKADFIANASQQGSGQAEERQRFENNTISPIASDSVNPTDDIVMTAQQKRQQAFQESYLRTTLSWEKSKRKMTIKKKTKATT